MIYNKVKLVKNDTETLAWIDSNFAIPGDEVEIKDEGRWKVAKVCYPGVHYLQLIKERLSSRMSLRDIKEVDVCCG